MNRTHGAALAAALFAFSASGTLAAPVKGKAAPPKAQKRASAPAKNRASALGITAEQVMERYVEATGGRAAYAKITSMVTKGTIENVAQGIRGTFAATVKTPNKIRVEQSLPGIAEVRQGFDGTTGWSQDPFSGLRTLEGQELAAMKRMSQFDSQSNWRGQYKKAEVSGKRKVGARNAFVVRLTPATGKPTVAYYDAQNFLLLRMDMVVESPQGSIPMEMYFSDYREVAGLKMPYVTRQRVGGIAELLMKITDIQTNVAVDDAIFAKPEATAPADPAKTVPSN